MWNWSNLGEKFRKERTLKSLLDSALLGGRSRALTYNSKCI